MKRKRVWRYYCEFCDKSGCHAGYLKKHERHCTNNPDRECGKCKIAGLNTKPVEELVEILGNGDTKNVEKLRDATSGCPACMLAAIRQSGLQRGFEHPDGEFSVDFDFEKEGGLLLNTALEETIRIMIRSGGGRR